MRWLGLALGSLLIVLIQPVPEVAADSYDCFPDLPLLPCCPLVDHGLNPHVDDVDVCTSRGSYTAPYGVSPYGNPYYGGPICVNIYCPGIVEEDQTHSVPCVSFSYSEIALQTVTC